MKKETGVYPNKSENRKRLSMPVSNRIMEVLSKNLHSLIAELVNNDSVSFSGITEMDVISETFEYVIRDQRLKNSTDEIIIRQFKQRYKMYYFKAVKNSRLRKKLNSCQQ